MAVFSSLLQYMVDSRQVTSKFCNNTLRSGNVLIRCTQYIPIKENFDGFN